MTAADAAEAVANARRQSSWDVGMCLNFVREPCWEVAGVFASAIDAWNGARYKHPGDRTPPLGAPLFYRGGNYGHVVIGVAENTANMRGTDMPSSGRVSEEQIAWVEQHWGYTYLGWTEDLNGVTLPLGEEEEVKDEDIERIARRVNKAMGDFDAEGEPDDGVEDPEYADQKLKQIENTVRRIEDDVAKILKKLG